MKSLDELDCSAPIDPDSGLGGLRLRSQVRELDLRGLNTSVPGEFKLRSAFEAQYILLDGRLEVWVDVRNGHIYKLVAGRGYAGALFGRIRVGMTFGEAMSLDSRLFLNEGEGFVEVRGVSGVSLGSASTDPLPGQIREMRIEWISVFAKEIQTLAGQDGDWLG